MEMKAGGGDPHTRRAAVSRVRFSQEQAEFIQPTDDSRQHRGMHRFDER
jgi:hypothetical protein